MLAAAALAAACAPAASSYPTVVVLAAASTIDALEAAVADFEAGRAIDVQVSFGPTSTIARQLEQGAPADLLLSASREWADHVEARLEVQRRTPLVGNRLVIVVPASTAADAGVPGAAPGGASAPIIDDPARLSALLAGAGRRFAVADPLSVPAGIYTRQALEGLGLWGTVEPRLVPTVDVRAALALVLQGEVEGAFVYASDAGGADVVTIGAFDPVLHEPIEYPLLLLAGASEEAAALFDFLVSARGRSHFLQRGFIDPGR